MKSIACALLTTLPFLFSSCSPSVDLSSTPAVDLNSTPAHDLKNRMVISVRDQKLLVVKNGEPIKAYSVSTSRFGLGSQSGSYRTPLGDHVIAKKIGKGAPKGAVFKSRRQTGVILKPNAKGRDPIVTRILWLSGKERHNLNTYRRFIYIHGTPVEKEIGRPVSYGCIRMKSKDIIDLYHRVSEGTEVKIIRGSLRTTPEGQTYYTRNSVWGRINPTRW
ncbi:L,D-transpeptidase [Akkermansiaceae bacterium]|jgi:lipoprotein-anchoring transpeptidase ErfK/SrfK|nr:L,D-transpeptidase [Akkermansiaceae bacterium]MDA7619040.1 L,D-transpeptidase [bacterium]MDA7528432.1 L,D-transpeptidase [Akkermansiaceae bacterium]MDA7538959.1 L,D-transpeptidase [Akkermansiaceae bacterium]MDA7616078.1 L,D-transpeptidase [Akkermansiaceae bacterium]